MNPPEGQPAAPTDTTAPEQPTMTQEPMTADSTSTSTTTTMNTTTTTPEKPPVTIYTDGACKGNPGPGGWGWHMDNGSSTREDCGGKRHTTNNEMELMAAIKALEFFPTPGRKLRVIADSKYLVKGMTEWLPKWIAKGWKGSAGQPVKNVDLWERLHAAAGRHQVTWEWVKGHSGNMGNDRADQLASAAAERAAAG